MPWFASQGYHCFALSLRGHGRSGGGRKSHFHQHSEDLAGVVEARYLVEQAIGLQRPQLRGAAFMAAAAITACKPDIQWLKEQRSIMHAAKVVW